MFKISELAARLRFSISNLYVRVLGTVATAVGVFIAITKALDMLSTGDTQTVMLGGLTFITAIFLGGWILAKIILGGLQGDEDESAGGRNSGSGSDHTAG